LARLHSGKLAVEPGIALQVCFDNYLKFIQGATVGMGIEA